MHCSRLDVVGAVVQYSVIFFRSLGRVFRHGNWVLYWSGCTTQAIMSLYNVYNMYTSYIYYERPWGSVFSHLSAGVLWVTFFDVLPLLYTARTNGPSSPACLALFTTQLFDSQELVQQSDGSLAKQFRVVGTNKVGMLAWHVEMRTPEYPEGRELVIIANDVTFQSGSFGVKEVTYFEVLLLVHSCLLSVVLRHESSVFFFSDDAGVMQRGDGDRDAWG